VSVKNCLNFQGCNSYSWYFSLTESALEAAWLSRFPIYTANPTYISVNREIKSLRMLVIIITGQGFSQINANNLA
ncbi:MAG TPA: hypothetical protein DEG17_23605, partial [Cyanobacteria bacterium UBA11149]|nr:hypothetical protein [Cyanobacteria bacterium UBA11149]